ncbi:hypothetical protein OB2597_09814 [Pseudooceanicola batsensis HTCC2597]|uniref:DUF2332 domain-containing protein n=1 Tax=Pseudooceanicola batsensis (strain ATCC BAA-863 / DSM 15984 / KCTC 12145 / HTCC2597) TaxID=252305 RepID=A3TV85_PSEBH|nr:DUF2332 family protein [Pseudooceanicola batsensis]EAQ04431.1 hypothetical protein OB2597_09814 [Pseudooceanicola batsensis HTCC2597]
MSLTALFESQARACERLGSPFMSRLLRLSGPRLVPGHPVTDRLLAWEGDATALGAAIALRFAGALHALVLLRRDADLVAAYPPNQVGDTMLWRAVEAAMTRHQDHMLHWIDSAPQTNEVRRSVAMIAVSHLLAERFPGLPFRLSELGASAGLNLHFDRFALALPDGTTRGAKAPVLTLAPDWQGPLPPLSEVVVSERRGVDLNPLDPSDPAAVLRLRSYVWPDQPDRMLRLDAALAVAGPVVDRGDAGDWLARRLATAADGMIDLVYHTIAWQYFPAATRTACRAALRASGARATPRSPLAHLQVEAEAAGEGATVSLTLWTGQDEPEVFDLGRLDPHGRSIITSDPFDLRPR